MSVFRLPSDYLTYLLSEWLTVKELGLFDSAITNGLDRPMFLDEISRTEFICDGTTKFESDLSQPYYIRWLHLRSIKVRSMQLCLTGLIVIDMLWLVSKISVESIYFHLVEYGAIEIISKVLSKCPNLTKISLCSVEFSELQYFRMVYSLSHPEKLKVFEFGSTIGFTFVALSRISKHCRNIEVLDLAIDDSSLLTSNLRFQFKSLRVLDLTDCYSLQDNYLSAILQGCPNLQKLKMNQSKDITDAAFINIQLPCLTHLQLRFTNDDVEYDNLIPFFSPCVNLIEVNLRCGEYSDVIPFLAQNSNLQTIKFFICGFSVANLVLLVKACPNLRVIQIECADYLTDELLDALLSHCYKLENVTLVYHSFSAEKMLAMSSRCKFSVRNDIDD